MALRHRNYANAINAGKDLWMTEHTVCSPPNCPATPAIGDAISIAEEIHNSMTVGYYNAYVYWWIWNNPADNINYGLINSSTSSPAPTYWGYGIGQFSKFIQPGYVRVSATASPAPDVYVSAYSGNGKDVIVVINAGTSTPLAFTLKNTSVTSMTPYQTTSGGGLAQQTAISVSNGQFTYTLPAQSITTLVTP
jgi:glucuronoarabinoxylan endo-1,4-beta-xylanase